MRFVTGISAEKLQERAVRGHYQKVAVGCWFTSSGKSTPKLIKYEDENGVLHTMNNIKVLSTEKKYYAGVFLQKYDCCVVDSGVMKNFILLYHPGEDIWDLVLPENAV